MNHRHPTVQEIVVHLGDIVALKLFDGRTVYGRVDAADEERVYLGRAEPPSAKEVYLSRVQSIGLVQGIGLPTMDSE